MIRGGVHEAIERGPSRTLRSLTGHIGNELRFLSKGEERSAPSTVPSLKPFHGNPLQDVSVIAPEPLVTYHYYKFRVAGQ
jgi:hypothetical protein